MIASDVEHGGGVIAGDVERAGGPGADPVERYLREAAYRRRIQMRQLGLLFGLFAAMSVALGTLMSDIGHFLGFVGLAVLFAASGVVIWWLGRR